MRKMPLAPRMLAAAFACIGLCAGAAGAAPVGQGWGPDERDGAAPVACERGFVFSRSNQVCLKIGSDRFAQGELYEQGEALVFMDSESYEQLELQKDFVGDRSAFLQDGMTVTVELYEEKPIGISLPDQVTLQITEADPVVKGQTAASSYKPAMLENGIRVLVPPFISSGERIVVDTNELTYIRRAE